MPRYSSKRLTLGEIRDLPQETTLTRRSEVSTSASPAPTSVPSP